PSPVSTNETVSSPPASSLPHNSSGPAPPRRETHGHGQSSLAPNRSAVGADAMSLSRFRQAAANTDFRRAGLDRGNRPRQRPHRRHGPLARSSPQASPAALQNPRRINAIYLYFFLLWFRLICQGDRSPSEVKSAVVDSGRSDGGVAFWIAAV